MASNLVGYNMNTPSQERQRTVCLKTNHNGTLLTQEVTEVSAKLCTSAWDAVCQQSSISFNIRCFFMALKLGIILNRRFVEHDFE